MILEVLQTVLLATIASMFAFFMGYAFGLLARKQIERRSKGGRR